MKELKKKILRENGYDEWQVDRTGTLVAPDGCRIEDDGECPHGHESPLLEMGFI